MFTYPAMIGISDNLSNDFANIARVGLSVRLSMFLVKNYSVAANEGVTWE